MASLGRFLSSHGKKHPDPKSGCEVNPDKPGCTIPEMKLSQNFHMLFFWILVPTP